MDQKSLIAEMAGLANITKAEATRALMAIRSVIEREVVRTGRFEMAGVGVFKRAFRAACQRPNPQHPGEKVQVLEHHTVTFKPSPSLKEAVNK